MIIQLNRFPPKASKTDIRSLFETYGSVQGIVKVPKTAYVRMRNDRRAKIAIKNLDGMKWKGWQLKVDRMNSKKTSPVCRTPIGVMRLF